jgi:hypothetical protein
MKTAKPNRFVLIALLVVSVAFLFYAMSGKRPTEGKKRRLARKARAVAAEKAPRVLAAAAPADAEFGRYDIIIKRNVFSPPAPPPPLEPKSLPPLPVVPPSPPPPLPAPPPAPQPPSFPGWSYAGYVEINGKMMGVLQNPTDHSFEYVGVGETFRGATVTKVTPTEIQLTVGAAPPAVLTRAETYLLVPLEKGATAAQTPARPGRQPPVAQPPPSTG